MLRLKYFESLRTLAAVLISFLSVAVLIMFVSKTPFVAMNALTLGPLSNLRRFGNVLEMTVPLTFTGLAVCVMFRANQFNMVAEGAFFLGATVAAMSAIYFPLPPVVIILVTLMGGLIAGCLIGMIPAVLKIKTGATEIVVSLMLNYIITLFCKYMLVNVIRDPKSGSGSSYAFQNIAKLPVLIEGTRIHLGIFVAILAVIVVAVMIYKTRIGYAVRITGVNANFAKYSGIGVGSVIIFSQALGGGLAGLGGAVEMMGMYNRMSWLASPGYGWDGIIIAILAKLNPVYVPLAAFFLAYVRIGADSMAMSTDVPTEIIAVVQATIILLLAADRFLAVMKDKMEKKTALKAKVD